MFVLYDELLAISFRYGIYGNHNDEVDTNSTVTDSIKGVRLLKIIITHHIHTIYRTFILQLKASIFTPNRSLIFDQKEKKKRDIVPLGKKRLGYCGRMPGDPKDQIDFTKEGNTVGKN